MPGTHCKWVQVQNGVVRQFATAMTGELHYLLMTQSLIGKGLPAQQPDDAAFERGLEKGLAQPSLISELFVAGPPGCWEVWRRAQSAITSPGC